MPVEVKYEPYKELVIKDYKYEPSAEKLASLVAPMIAAGGQAYLQWADGIVFAPNSASADEQYEDLLEGKVVWLAVVFAPMAKFSSVIRANGIEVPIINATENELSRAAVEWLKTRIPKVQ